MSATGSAKKQRAQALADSERLNKSMKALISDIGAAIEAGVITRPGPEDREVWKLMREAAAVMKKTREERRQSLYREYPVPVNLDEDSSAASSSAASSSGRRRPPVSYADNQSVSIPTQSTNRERMQRVRHDIERLRDAIKLFRIMRPNSKYDREALSRGEEAFRKLEHQDQELSRAMVVLNKEFNRGIDVGVFKQRGPEEREIDRLMLEAVAVIKEANEERKAWNELMQKNVLRPVNLDEIKTIIERATSEEDVREVVLMLKNMPLSEQDIPAMRLLLIHVYEKLADLQMTLNQNFSGMFGEASKKRKRLQEMTVADFHSEIANLEHLTIQLRF